MRGRRRDRAGPGCRRRPASRPFQGTAV